MTRGAPFGASRRAGRSRGSTRARRRATVEAPRARAARANASSVARRRAAFRLVACSRRARARGPRRGRRRRCTSRRRRSTPARGPASRSHAASLRTRAAGSPPVGRACAGLVQCVCRPNGTRAARRGRARVEPALARPRRMRRPAAASARSRRSLRGGAAAARRTARQASSSSGCSTMAGDDRDGTGRLKAHCHACAGSADSIHRRASRRRRSSTRCARGSATAARIRARPTRSARACSAISASRCSIRSSATSRSTNETADVVAVFNGELYNFPELREELARARPRGPRTRRHAGHAAPLRGATGPRFVEHLDGMFAIALWDAPRGRLVLARDRLGKKPLVWTRLADGTLAFASELKSLLALRRRGSRAGPGRARCVPRAPVRPGRAHRAAWHPAAAAGLAPRRRGSGGADSALLGADAVGRDIVRRRMARARARCGRRRRPETSRVGRPARRAALRWARLHDRRRADGAGVAEPSADVHGRVRRRALRRAAVRTRRR